jgi:carbon monoxide dehydrogenase subunit G
MARQVVEVQAASAAPPEAVWRLLADVTTWTDWTRFDEAGYEREGTPPPHGVDAVRRFRAGPLRSSETVLAFDPPRHLAYDYRGSLPFEGYRADVTLAPLDGGTRITWHAEFTARLPLVGPTLRVVMTRVLRDIASRLARAAEGRPGR